jgi:hypothetical protein
VPLPVAIVTTMATIPQLQWLVANDKEHRHIGRLQYDRARPLGEFSRL